MSNRTMFSDSDLQHIESIVKDLKIDGRCAMKINGIAHSFFMNNAQDPRKMSNLTTEAWVNAIIQYMILSGYEISKKD